MQDPQHSVHMVAAIVGGVSYGLLWLSVVSGIVLRAGWASVRIRHATLHGTHQVIVLLGLCLGVVHAVAQLAVPAGPVRWLDEVVPFVNHDDLVGIGFAVIALELMLALTLSVLIQRWLGHRRWRRLHALSYLAFTLLTGHLLISGSDLRTPRMRVLVAAAWTVTVLLWLATTVRVDDRPRTIAERVAIRLRGSRITVNVNPTGCLRSGFCEQEAPQVFHLRRNGRLSYRSPVPADQVEAVTQAARACPARAIVLSRRAITVTPSGPLNSAPVPGWRARLVGFREVRHRRREHDDAARLR